MRKSAPYYTIVVGLAFWPLLALVAYATFALGGVPAPRNFLVYVALAWPVVNVAAMLSWPNFMRHQRKLNELSGKQIWKISKAGSLWWGSLLLGVWTGGLVFVEVADEQGLPSVPSIATPIGAMLLIAWFSMPTMNRRRWRAMREIGRIPICAACGHELESLAVSCTECGWRDEETPDRPRTRLGTKLAAVGLIFVLTLLPLCVLAFPTADARAESAAVAKVDALLASAGVESFGSANAWATPRSGGRLVTGWHRSASDQANWAVLVDDAMQPVAWVVDSLFGGRIAVHNTQMFDPSDLSWPSFRRTIGKASPRDDVDVHPAERPNDR